MGIILFKKRESIFAQSASCQRTEVIMLTFSNLNLWLHILSTVTWIGAILFTWWVLIPGVKAIYPLEQAVLKIIYIEKKFRKIAHPVITLIAITGVLNLMTPAAIEKFRASPSFGILVTVKVLLLALLIFTHILRQASYAKKIEASAENQKIPDKGLTLWKKSERVLILQALLGFILIFVGINLR